MDSLQGKRVLITGGAKRIGKAIATAFAQAGCELIIHCHQSWLEARKLAEAWPKTQLITADLTDFDAEKLLEEAGRVDILVNNAAFFVYPRPEVYTEVQLRTLHQVNCLAPTALMAAMYHRLLPGQTGTIINILDQALLQSKADRTDAYWQSKDKLRQATLQAARDYAPQIRVNAVLPGAVLPPVNLAGPGLKKVLAQIPLQKPVDLADLAQSVLFLAQNQSLNGVLLPVDCGQHLPDGTNQAARQ